MSTATSVFAASENREATRHNRLGFAFWLLVTYFAVEYLRPQAIVEALAPLHIPMLITLLMPLAWLAAADKRPLKDSLVILNGIFVGLVAVSVTYAVNQYWVFETFKQMTIYLLAATLPAAGLLVSRQRLVTFFNCWIVIHVLLALWAVAHQGRGTGSFLEDENDLSLALNMAVPYAYYLLQRPGQRLWRRLFYMAAIAALAAGVVVSESRGGFLGLMAVCFGIVLFSRQRLRNLLIIGVFGLIGLAAVSGQYLAEMRTITDTQDATRQDRLYSWGRGWEMFVDHPLLGVGASNYPWRIVEYEIRSEEYHPDRRRLHGGRVAHSLYFTLLPELGLAGTLLFVSMAWIMYRRLIRIIRADSRQPATFASAPELPLLARAMVVSMFGLFVSGAFISVLYYPHFWSLIGFVIGLCAASAQLLPGLGRTLGGAGGEQHVFAASTGTAARLSQKP
jgi:probable O-glycosylation ligase (exosortase A-associated)